MRKSQQPVKGKIAVQVVLPTLLRIDTLDAPHFLYRASGVLNKEKPATREFDSDEFVKENEGGPR